MQRKEGISAREREDTGMRGYILGKEGISAREGGDKSTGMRG